MNISFETARLATDKGYISPDLRSGWIENLFGEVVPLSSAKNNSYKFYTIIRGSTQSELQKWLRDNHKLHPHICYLTDVNVWNLDWYDLTKEYGLITLPFTIQADSYEEVLEIGLYEGLKLIKEAL